MLHFSFALNFYHLLHISWLLSVFCIII
jgi:hypothetical protein